VAINLGNLRSYADINQRVVTSVIGTPYPSTPTGSWGAGWFDIGALSDKGVDESVNQNETKVWIWQGGQLGRILRSQFEHPFTIEAAEENAVSLGLARPNVSVATTGATAEVQTVTISGTGTAGTWTYALPGYGTATGLAFNIATAALATAISALLPGSLTVTVSGTAGTSYAVTFPTALGNVPQAQVTQNITGATGIANATTTPGVSGTNRSVVAPYSGMNLRQFGFDFTDGVVNLRYIVTNAEAVLSGNISRNANGIAVVPLTINPYYDASIGGFFIDLNNDPARGQGLYA